jgi:hypothetical protein
MARAEVPPPGPVLRGLHVPRPLGVGDAACELLHVRESESWRTMDSEAEPTRPITT